MSKEVARGEATLAVAFLCAVQFRLLFAARQLQL
jgi:hypothetical protein